MTKTFLKNILRTITGSLGRYLAILLITFLGVGFVAGLQLTQPVMSTTEALYLSEHEMFDLRLISTIGFDEETVEAAAKLEHVRAAAGSFHHDMITMVGNRELVVRAQMLTDGVNLPSLEAGRMPEKPDECLLDYDAFGTGIIGQNITLAGNNDEETKDAFAFTTYTVTGVARTPLAISSERGTTTLGSGSLSGYMFIPEEGFNYTYYTEMYIRLDHDLAPYSEEYIDFTQRCTEEIKQQMDAPMQLHLETVRLDSEEKIAEAEATLASEKADAQATLDEALEELEKGAREIADSEQAIADGQAELDSAKITLDAAAGSLQAGYSELCTAAESILPGYTSFTQAYDYALQQLESAQNMVDLAMAVGNQTLEATRVLLQNRESAYEENVAQMVSWGIPEELARSHYRLTRIALDNDWADYQEAVNALESRRAEMQAPIDENKAQLDTFYAGIQAYNQGWSAYQSGLETYEQGCQELENARAELEEGKAAYEEGKAAYDDGVKELADKVAEAEEQIQDARDRLESMDEYTLFVLDRTTNEGYVSFESAAAIVEDIAKLFPVFFFLIAALVCSTTMARMIEDERTQIGTLRAMGYSRSTILAKYLIYSGSAGFIGGTLGYFIFGWLFPKAIWITYGMLYKIDGYVAMYEWGLYIILICAALLCTCGTTYLALRREMEGMPAEMIRPRTPKAGKRILLERIPFLWKRLSFLRKVAMRNIFRFKKRMIMMVLGIAGCTALILTAFGIHDSIALVCDFQYDDILKYDISVSCSESVDSTDVEKIFKGQQDFIDASCLLMTASGDLEGGNMTKSASMIISDDPAISDLIDLHLNGRPVAYPGKGEVVLTEKLAALTGIKVGDTVTIAVTETDKADFVVSDLAENYVFNYIYMSAESFEAFEKEYSPSTIYLRLKEGVDDHRIGAAISSRNKVMSITMVSDFRKSVGNMMQSLNYVVAVVLLSAAGLAFVVLFNLGNINITERVREIATLKVLGFRRRETGAYVFRENLFLSIMGIIPGLPLGVLLHRFVMSQINVDMVSFKIVVNGISYLLTVLLVLLFTYATDLILRHKIDRIHMAESLKSVE